MALFTGVILLLFLGLTLLPVGAMLWRFFALSDTLAASLTELLFSTHGWELLVHSVLLASLVTLSTTMAGVPLGILLGKVDLPFRRFLTFLLFVPLMLPPYIFAVAWNAFLRTAGFPMETLSGLGGTFFILFAVYLPLPTLATMLFLRTVPSRLEEAGRLCASWPTVLRSITLPTILPGILLAALIVFLLTLGESSVPMYLHYDVYAVESFVQFSAFYRFDTATAATLPLVAAALCLTLVENLYLRNRTAFPRHFADSDTFLRIDPGESKYPLLLFTATWTTVTVLLPMTGLAMEAGNFTHLLDAFTTAFDALSRTLLYAAAGATLLTFFGFFIGYTLFKHPFRGVEALDAVTIFLFTLPGTVIAIAFILFWNTPSTNLVYATPLILLLGYLAKYAALTGRLSFVGLSSIPPSMEEAAQIAGAGWFGRLRHILLPLAMDAIAGSWIVAFLFILRDTDLTTLLYPSGNDTLSVRIFTTMANGSPETVASLCLVMAATVLLPASAAWIHFIGKERRR
ncbi:ABC transporter permease [Hydrogenimonas sp.]